MAKSSENLLLKNFRGKIGNQLVVKQYANKIVIAAYPNMPKDKPTKLQLLYRKRFSEAVKYAHKIASDPVLSATYQTKLAHGQHVVNYAISEYLREIKEKEGPRFQS